MVAPPSGRTAEPGPRFHPPGGARSSACSRHSPASSTKGKATGSGSSPYRQMSVVVFTATDKSSAASTPAATPTMAAASRIAAWGAVLLGLCGLPLSDLLRAADLQATLRGTKQRAPAL
jgi:hypothetical protein